MHLHLDGNIPGTAPRASATGASGLVRAGMGKSGCQWHVTGSVPIQGLGLGGASDPRQLGLDQGGQPAGH